MKFFDSKSAFPNIHTLHIDQDYLNKGGEFLKKVLHPRTWIWKRIKSLNIWLKGDTFDLFWALGRTVKLDFLTVGYIKGTYTEKEELKLIPLIENSMFVDFRQAASALLCYRLRKLQLPNVKFDAVSSSIHAEKAYLAIENDPDDSLRFFQDLAE